MAHGRWRMADGAWNECLAGALAWVREGTMSRPAAGAMALALMVTLGGADAALAAGPKAYVGLFKDDAVAGIDTTQNRVVATIPVPKGPHGLVVTPDGRKAYVSSDGASTVSVIDTATGRVVGEVAVPQVHNGTLSADGSRAYVASQKQGEAAIVILDLKTMTRAGAVPLDKTPRALDLSPDGKRLYFTLAGVNAVQVLDTVTNQVVAQIPVGASPHEAPFTADGRGALAVSQGPGELGVLDVSSGSVAGTVTVGKLPHWVASTSDGRTAY